MFLGESLKKIEVRQKKKKTTPGGKNKKKSVFLSIQLILKTTFVQGKKNLARERERV